MNTTAAALEVGQTIVRGTTRHEITAIDRTSPKSVVLTFFSLEDIVLEGFNGFRCTIPAGNVNTVRYPNSRKVEVA